jgi:vanillate/3-O-methylgallate O-demethylase
MTTSLKSLERPRSKFISLPVPMYATFEYDAVQLDGATVGISQWSSYSSNAGSVLSTALIENEKVEMGKEVTLLWGEPNSRRHTVEEHEIIGIRATMAPVPFFEKTIKID